MYSITIEASFDATHSVMLPDGKPEPNHSHHWIVRAVFVAAELDALGMVVDFEAAQRALTRAVGDLHEADLTKHVLLGPHHATAERVARLIFDKVNGDRPGMLARVEVTEAPGCLAAYHAPAPHGGVQTDGPN